MRFADTSDPASRYWIEVHGQDFGGADVGASAFVGGAACRRTVWVNDSVVRCDAPSLAGSDFDLSIELAGQGSPHVPESSGATRIAPLALPPDASGFSPALPEVYGARVWTYPEDELPPPNATESAVLGLPEMA